MARSRIAVCALLAAVLGVALAASAASLLFGKSLGLKPPAARQSSGVSLVRVDLRARSPTVPRSFLGLSIEWDSVLPYTGPAKRRRAALLSLLAAIARASRSPTALRIGGDTADQAWWDPAHRPRPRLILQDLGPRTLDAVAWLARGLGGPVALGVNLALGDPENARRLVAAARRRLPHGALAAVEVGNEPDLYRHGHTFTRGGHVHRRLAKDPHYDLGRYARQTMRYLRVLSAASVPAPLPRLTVASFAGPAWWPALPRLLRGPWAGRAGELAAHLYALPACASPTPSLSWLTSPAASTERVAYLRPLAAIARRAHLPLRIAELNSAACGGRPRWSDTSAAALWLTDTLFAGLRLGAAEVDLHTWHGALYAPFAVARRGPGVAPRPPLAGLLAFAHAAPAGTRLVLARTSSGSTLRAWATTDGRGTERVALLAPDAVRALVPAAGRSGCAALWRPTPLPAGTARCVCPRRGRYAVPLPTRSVAVLTLPRAAFMSRSGTRLGTPSPCRS